MTESLHYIAWNSEQDQGQNPLNYIFAEDCTCRPLPVLSHLWVGRLVS